MLDNIRPIVAEPGLSLDGSLGNTVYQQLKEAILLQERLPTTMVLQEIELSERFNVSRTPVREALRNLLNEGLVRRNGRFYQITVMSPQEIRHLYEVREALEAMAVRLCAERASNISMKKLYEIVEAQVIAVAEKDTSKFVSLDSMFHLAIASATENQFLYEQLSSVHDKVMLVRAQEPPTSAWFDGAIAEHERILSALMRRDAAVADGEMRYHLNSVVRLHLGSNQESHQQLFSNP